MSPPSVESTVQFNTAPPFSSKRPPRPCWHSSRKSPRGLALPSIGSPDPIRSQRRLTGHQQRRGTGFLSSSSGGLRGKNALHAVDPLRGCAAHSVRLRCQSRLTKCPDEIARYRAFSKAMSPLTTCENGIHGIDPAFGSPITDKRSLKYSSDFPMT